MTSAVENAFTVSNATYVEHAVSMMQPQTIQETRAATIIANRLYCCGLTQEIGERMLKLLPKIESYVHRQAAVGLMMRLLDWRLASLDDDLRARICQTLLEYVYLNGEDDSDDDYMPE